MMASLRVIVMVAVLVLLLVAPAPAGHIDGQSLCLPTGPAPEEGYQNYEDAVGARAGNIIQNVPSYLWKDGCGPTAAGMVIGYYDGQGFAGLIAGDASTQTTAVNAAIASPAHYADYSLPKDYAPNPILPDKSSTGGAHSPHNCLGDFMNTSWSARNNYYGWSWSSDVSVSLQGYTNTYVNNTQGTSYVANAWRENYGAFTWNDFKAEIDAQRPMVFLVDSNGDGGTDHFITAIGYRDTYGYYEYACFDTWSHNVRWERFREMSSAYDWGIYDATYFTITPEPGAALLALVVGAVLRRRA